jgi:hypothetical protein
MTALEEEKPTTINKYMVTRNDIRISDEQFTLEDAKKELSRLESILKRWPDGSIIKIVPIV